MTKKSVHVLNGRTIRFYKDNDTIYVEQVLDDGIITFFEINNEQALTVVKVLIDLVYNR